MEALERSSGRSLARWFGKSRRKPLVIRGARQVGKSTLVRQFAARQSLRLREINLERHTMLESAFATFDVPNLLRELEGLAGGPIRDGDLLFLDEIQATPSALAALRYLYEERPGLAVVAAGSLLEMLLGEHGFSMPVGRIEYHHLGPLHFSEFLRALGETHLLELIQHWEPGTPLAQTAHQKLETLQREFLLVGGMPEAVSAWVTDRSLEDVSDVHRSIVATYRDDFSKYVSTPSQLRRLQRVFDFVPAALGSKVKYSHIDRDARAREVRAAIELLAQARVIWLVHHSDASGVPVETQTDPNTYKALFLDVGLAAHALGVRWSTLGHRTARQLVNEGGLAEQFVGQHLLFRAGGGESPSLVYWLRQGRTKNAEVDYVVTCGSQVIPVEVKAGSSGSLKSLHQFLARGVKGQVARLLAVRLDANPPSHAALAHKLSDGKEVPYRLLSLPLYMVGEIDRLLDLLLAQAEA